MALPDAVSLAKDECDSLMSQIAMSTHDGAIRSTLPWVFTEHGVAMLSVFCAAREPPSTWREGITFCDSRASTSSNGLFTLFRFVPFQGAPLSIGNLPFITVRIVSLEPEQLVNLVHRIFHDDLHFSV